MARASSKCPCGKAHARLADGSIGDVPAAPFSTIHEWMAQLPPLSPLLSRGGGDNHDGGVVTGPGEMEARVQWVDRMIVGAVAWDATPLREAELRRLYANTPTPGRREVRDGQLDWVPTAQTVTYHPPRT